MLLPVLFLDFQGKARPQNALQVTRVRQRPIPPHTCLWGSTSHLLSPNHLDTRLGGNIWLWVKGHASLEHGRAQAECLSSLICPRCSELQPGSWPRATWDSSLPLTSFPWPSRPALSGQLKSPCPSAGDGPSVPWRPDKGAGHHPALILLMRALLASLPNWEELTLTKTLRARSHSLGTLRAL